MKKYIILITLAVLIILIPIYLYFENTTLELTYYTVNSDKISDEFDNYTIAQITDFHNINSKRLTENQLVNNLKINKPDIIVITGDLIDSRTTNIDIAISFINQIQHIAPIYYVTGNHESRVEEYSKLETLLKESNVIVLRNEKILLPNSNIELIGVDDPSFHKQNDNLKEMKSYMNKQLSSLTQNTTNNDTYKILLSHRPELFNSYIENNIDLIFSGHAHGGQIRLPFIGGLIAPNQGFPPKYIDNIYTMENSNLVVSRGIGNSLFPFRINNRPELVFVKLTK